MANKPDAPDINPDDNDEAVKEINKSKFWHWISVEQKKLAIIASSIVAICAIGNFGWMGISWLSTEIHTKNSKLANVAATQEAHRRRLDSVCTIMDSAVKYEIVNRYHLMITDSIIASDMKSVVIDSVRFLRSVKGQLYYYTNGMLYLVEKYKDKPLYYYLGDDGKTYWCE